MIPEQIITALLMASPEVVAAATGGVHAALVPEGAPLPAIAYRRVDAVVLHRPVTVKPGSVQLCRARMRVVVVTATDGGYVDGKTLMQLVRQACSSKVGTIAGFAGSNVSAPMVTPELPDPVTGLSFDANDFMVTYRESLA